MNLLQVASVIIIAGVALFILAGVSAPPGLYAEPDIDRRVAMLREKPARWIASQWLFGLGVLVPALGFGLLAAGLRGGPGGGPAALGAAALLAGSCLAAYWVYVQTQDPGAFWRMPEVTAPGLALAALNVAGLLLFGLALVQSPLPDWTGYLMAGYGALFVVVALALRGGGGFFLLAGMYLAALAAAVGVLRG